MVGDTQHSHIKTTTIKQEYGNMLVKEDRPALTGENGADRQISSKGAS